MAQRRHHYEQAFEAFLRAERIPYVAVNEAKKALLPRLPEPAWGEARPEASLKSFDFVVYGAGLNLLVEIKGRRVPVRRDGASARRLESWVAADDVSSMLAWEGLFGPEFRAVFLFMYWHDALPADGLFEEIVEHRGRWYALRAVGVREYAAAMRVRSPRWGTVDLPGAVYARLSQPFRGSLAASGVGLAEPAMEPIGG
ncbi:MAG TPA: HYExAFE family protein [Phycisphaerales bacterium]|nr:HYExAFE family protein [Phycisphaerales bacterium]